MAYTVDDCPHIGCGHCAFSSPGKCKRIDGKKVRFYKSPFMCSTNPFHIPCRNFMPANPQYADFKEWTTFEDFWPVYVKAWLPYENENISIPFTLYWDKKNIYYVPLHRFIYGTMISDGVLHATGRTYQTKDKIKHGVQLYKGIGVRIDGVKIDPDENLYKIEAVQARGNESLVYYALEKTAEDAILRFKKKKGNQLRVMNIRVILCAEEKERILTDSTKEKAIL